MKSQLGIIIALDSRNDPDFILKMYSKVGLKISYHFLSDKQWEGFRIQDGSVWWVMSLTEGGLESGNPASEKKLCAFGSGVSRL